jgi:YVTN family beta-propeller protein
VSVALRDNNEAWVVNNLSDDVSIVDLTTMHVRATLHVGDEPSDIVFAGPSSQAFVSVSQEDAIKVYDPATLAQVSVIRWRAAGRELATNVAKTLVFTAIFAPGIARRSFRRR